MEKRGAPQSVARVVPRDEAAARACIPAATALRSMILPVAAIDTALVVKVA